MNPARIAEMFAPLATAKNAQIPTRRVGITVRPVVELHGWDLARLWYAASGGPVPVASIGEAADLGTHKATHGVAALEATGWLQRQRTATGDTLTATVPAPEIDDNAPGSRSPQGGDMISYVNLAGGLNPPRLHADRGRMNPIRVVVELSIYLPGGAHVTEDPARMRADAPTPGAHVTDDPARMRADPSPPGAQVTTPPARMRADTPPGGAQVTNDPARMRAEQPPRALSKENQSVSLLSPEEKTDRSIDQTSRGWEWGKAGLRVPDADSSIAVRLAALTGTPYESARGDNAPTLRELFRRFAPGRVFAAALNRIEAGGSCNVGGLSGATVENLGRWDFDETRAALLAFGVESADLAAKLAPYLCPLTVAALAERFRSRPKSYAAVGTVGRWALKCVQGGELYADAARAARERFTGRENADKARNGTQLAANAARLDAKAQRERDAQEAERRKAAELEEIRNATDRELREALAHLVTPGARRTNVVCTNATRKLITDALAEKQTPRDVARLDRVRPFAVHALNALAAKEPARG